MHIFYENEDFLLINKESGLAVHEADSLKEPSLVERLSALRPEQNRLFRCGLIHRLDKATSGLLLVAKNEDFLQELQELFAQRSPLRLYLALLDRPLREDLELECFLKRNEKMRIKQKASRIKDKELLMARASTKPELGLRYAKSIFKNIDEEKALIAARLITGRKHQIRASLELLGRGILGDKLYAPRLKAERMMLHSCAIGFRYKGKNFSHFCSPNFLKDYEDEKLKHCLNDAFGITL